MNEEKVTVANQSSQIMTKEQIKEALFKRPDEVTPEQLDELFGIFCFQIKEYQKSKYNISFEIHYKTNYIIRVIYPLINGMALFNNEFVNMGDGCNRVEIRKFKHIAELIILFINMFSDNLLARVRYTAYYNEELSYYSSVDEAQEHLEFVQGLMETYTKEL